jgi:transposase
LSDCGFPSAKTHSKLPVDDRRVVGGIVLDNQNELRWRDAPSVSGPHQTINNQWERWSERGVFTRLMKRLVAGNAEPKNVMIDATYLKAHRTASNQGWRGSLCCLIERSKGGMNTKLHAVIDADDR